jgi:hypothetical protein
MADLPINISDFHSTEVFLGKCEQLDYRERIQHAIEAGKALRGSAAATRTVQTLFKGPLYERRLALFTACGSQDPNLPIEALSDSSYDLRKLAARLVSQLASDEEVLPVLRSAAPDTLRFLIKACMLRNRLGLVDKILGILKIEQSDVFRTHFIYGSAAFIQQQLESDIPMNKTLLLRLCRIHPLLACQKFTEWKSSTSNDDFLVGLFSQALVVFSKQTIDKVVILRMIQNMIQLVDLQKIWRGLEHYWKRMANEIVDLVIAKGEGINSASSPFCKMVNKIPVAKLLELNKRRPHFVSIAGYFHKLDPQRRVDIYKTVWKSQVDSFGFVSADSFVKYLPGDIRLGEARRHLAMPAMKTKESLLMQYASLLPWEECRLLLSSFIRSSEIETRRLAMSQLIESVQRDPDSLTKALDLAIWHKNEPDPVRGNMMGALAKLPIKAFSSADLPKLEQIFKHVLDASDRSTSTTYSVPKIIFRLFRKYPSWAAKQFLWFTKESDFIMSLQTVEPKLTTDSVLKELDSLFRPLIEESLSRKKYREVSNLLSIFKKNFGLTPYMISTIQQIALEVEPHWEVDRCIEVLDEEPDLQKDLMLQLLAKDPTYIQNHYAQPFISSSKQTLLSRYLVPFYDVGQYNQNGQSRVLLVQNGQHRWTPQQQETYAKTLTELINDTENGSRTLRHYVRVLGKMNYTESSAKTLHQLISDKRIYIRDVAIQTLTHLDEGKGIPILAETLDDERASVSIYAFGRAQRRLPPLQAFQVLKSLSIEKVTVAKQVYRLMAVSGTDDALEYLLAKEKTPNLHIDVRIAIFRSLWRWIERPEVLEIMQEALKDPHNEIPISLVKTPLEPGSPANKYIVDLLMYALNHAPREVAFAALVRIEDEWLQDDTGKLALPLVKWALESKLPDEVGKASRALFRWYFSSQTDLLARLVQTVLPNKQRLGYVIQGFDMYSSEDPRQARTSTAILSILKSDPLEELSYITSVFRVLPAFDLFNVIFEIIPTLDYDMFAQIQSLVEGLRYSKPDMDLHALEQRLRVHKDERARRLGMSVLDQISQSDEGWSPELREHLETYRRDKSLLVRREAMWTFPNHQELP